MAPSPTPLRHRPGSGLIPILLLGLSLTATQGRATMTGECANCHTMHNSQNNAAMTFDGSQDPNPGLTRGTCLGCHAQGGNSPTVDVGGTKIPQVMHTGAVDLAGGNFAYITGMKGSGAADNKGHNIGALTGTDSVLYQPPGMLVNSYHQGMEVITTEKLTCAGTGGCHGYRHAVGLPNGVSGAHHKNVDGSLTVADSPANSYRFLNGVKGYESPDWQESPSSVSHNEYFALSEPIRLGCGAGICHWGAPGIKPPDGTISQFCGTCHANFHTLAVDATGVGAGTSGVGTSAASPFIRHPTDLSLPVAGEYSAYTVYNLDSPVARLSVPSASSSTVTPGSDAVMCLSCHVAHASNYPSMLRWDYSAMIAGNGGSAANTGCFVCHSTKS